VKPRDHRPEGRSFSTRVEPRRATRSASIGTGVGAVIANDRLGRVFFVRVAFFMVGA
jgi:hypothetical protein